VEIVVGFSLRHSSDIEDRSRTIGFLAPKLHGLLGLTLSKFFGSSVGTDTYFADCCLTETTRTADCFFLSASLLSMRRRIIFPETPGILLVSIFC
jgi:hypothetical protein